REVEGAVYDCQRGLGRRIGRSILVDCRDERQDRPSDHRLHVGIDLNHRGPRQCWISCTVRSRTAALFVLARVLITGWYIKSSLHGWPREAAIEPCLHMKEAVEADELASLVEADQIAHPAEQRNIGDRIVIAHHPCPEGEPSVENAEQPR